MYNVTIIKKYLLDREKYKKWDFSNSIMKNSKQMRRRLQNEYFRRENERII